MAGLGDFLAGGLIGGLQAVEGVAAENRAFEREKTLEEFRTQKLLVLEALKHNLAVSQAGYESVLREQEAANQVGREGTIAQNKEAGELAAQKEFYESLGVGTTKRRVEAEIEGLRRAGSTNINYSAATPGEIDSVTAPIVEVGNAQMLQLLVKDLVSMGAISEERAELLTAANLAGETPQEWSKEISRVLKGEGLPQDISSQANSALQKFNAISSELQVQLATIPRSDDPQAKAQAAAAAKKLYEAVPSMWNEENAEDVPAPAGATTPPVPPQQERKPITENLPELSTSTGPVKVSFELITQQIDEIRTRLAAVNDISRRDAIAKQIRAEFLKRIESSKELTTEQRVALRSRLDSLATG